MFTNVLVGVDGAEAGRDAIRLGLALAGPGGRLTLANVYGGVTAHSRPEHVDADDAGHPEALRLLAAERDATAVAAELIAICCSSVGRGLHTLAERLDVDLLVVG